MEPAACHLPFIQQFFGPLLPPEFLLRVLYIYIYFKKKLSFRDLLTDGIHEHGLECAGACKPEAGLMSASCCWVSQAATNEAMPSCFPVWIRKRTSPTHWLRAWRSRARNSPCKACRGLFGERNWCAQDGDMVGRYPGSWPGNPSMARETRPSCLEFHCLQI